MRHSISLRQNHSAGFIPWLAFWTIVLVHDNPLLPYLKEPGLILKAAGLKPGQKVLEVGCGPGFFTLPAAEIVGEKGAVYALDLNPYALKRVGEKVEMAGAKNIRPLLANASETGLSANSLDLAFMFGLPHIVGGREMVIREIGRVLRPGGKLSIQRSRGSEVELIEEVRKEGFHYSGKQGKVLLFERKQVPGATSPSQKETAWG